MPNAAIVCKTGLPTPLGIITTFSTVQYRLLVDVRCHCFRFFEVYSPDCVCVCARSPAHGVVCVCALGKERLAKYLKATPSTAKEIINSFLGIIETF